MIAKGSLSGFYAVECSPYDVARFKSFFPASGLPDNLAITFTYSANGDLVDIEPESEGFDGAGLVALSHDAQDFAKTQLEGKADRLTGRLLEYVPKVLDFKAEAEKAKGMSDTELWYAIQDASKAARVGDDIDRDRIDAARDLDFRRPGLPYSSAPSEGGFYRDQISVYRAELARRRG